ncbi:MAG TPA: DNA mismatch repair protein MutS, partial [Terriglobia bacterium]|nr:DNA mismatch repair protein MutS [Terriglobia bacterium]
MRALLMYRNQDFDPDQSLRYYPTYGDRKIDPRERLLPHERALIQDLELDPLLGAMANGDEFLLEVAERALLSGLRNDLDTILYRQEALKDCLRNPTVVQQLYGLAVEAIDGTRRRWWDMTGHYTSTVLYAALDLLEASLSILRKLRGVAEDQAGRVESEAFSNLFAMLRKELSDEYLASIQNHLVELKFRKGVLLRAQLGEWNESTDLALRCTPDEKLNWLERIFGKRPPGYTFHLAERDEEGGRILSDIRYRGIDRVTIALSQSADHVVSFFKMLRAELAFYCGCLNLHAQLTAKGEPVCFPTPLPAGQRSHRFTGLYDVCLALHMQNRVVGNAVDAGGKSLVIVTGANQGGKSTFLRSVGLAQLMMQCGMFVGAEKLEAELCSALFTHYKREEDATLSKGKLDEELARMSEIADHVGPNSMVLFNESFAATNEREGSEIARQIVCALLEKRTKILYVTHLYEFARSFFDRKGQDALFLRAERKADGARTFRLLEGEPLDTSYGEDLYR